MLCFNDKEPFRFPCRENVKIFVITQRIIF